MAQVTICASDRSLRRCNPPADGERTGISFITSNDRIRHEDFHHVHLIDFEDVTT